MLIVETSAFIAFALKEPTEAALYKRLTGEVNRAFPVHCLVEAHLVLSGRGGGLADAIDTLMSDLGLTLLPLTADHAAAARDAFDRYGKGRHPARLNYADCLSYGVAKAEDAPLLYVGGDFGKTDVIAAIPEG